MTSRSKNYYQGMHLKRVHRSEYDDTKLRDIARQDARLGVEMKTVERARNVMLKSMDADKQLFIKAGAQANSKMTRSIQGNWPRSSSQPPPHQSRLVSDSRTKKTSITDHGDLNGTRNPSGSNSNSNSRSHKQGPGSDSGSNANHEQKTSEQSTPDQPSIFDTTSIYDKFFEANTGRSSSTPTVPAQDEDARSSKLGGSTKLGGSGRGMTVITESDGQASQSTHRTTKHTSSHHADDPHKRAGSATSFSRPRDINGDDYTHYSEDRKENSTPTRKSTVSSREEGEDTGKKQSVWDALSTPKHTSNAKSKRSQIEKEFNTPTLKSSTSSPALLSMAKSSTTAAKGKTRRTSQTGSGSHNGRQADDSSKGRKLSSSSKQRNDT